MWNASHVNGVVFWSQKKQRFRTHQNTLKVLESQCHGSIRACTTTFMIWLVMRIQYMHAMQIQFDKVTLRWKIVSCPPGGQWVE